MRQHICICVHAHMQAYRHALQLLVSLKIAQTVSSNNFHILLANLLPQAGQFLLNFKPTHAVQCLKLPKFAKFSNANICIQMYSDKYFSLIALAL